MKQVGPMQMLLHVYSILKFSGPQAMPEIIDKLILRGIKLDINSVSRLGKLLNEEAAARFGIRRLVGTKAFMVMPEVIAASAVRKSIEKSMSATVIIDPVPVKSRGRQPNPKNPEIKAQIIEFCKRNGRAPSQLIESEKKMYQFMLHHAKSDPAFGSAVHQYRGRQRGRNMTRKLADEIEVGMQLAESGGSGL